MRRRDLLRLGVSLGWATGRVGRLRSVVLTAVLATVWVLVLAACAMPGLVQQRTARVAARSVDPSTRGPQAPLLRVAERHDRLGDRTVGLVFVAATPGVAPPPGVDQLPAVGSAVVSPALAAALQEGTAPGLAARVGRVAGRIGDAGLVGPGELRAYVGTDARTLDAVLVGSQPPTARGDRFGAPAPSLDAEVDGWVGGVLLVFAAPVVALLVAAIRLSATARDRQLAALRLLGLGPADATYVVVGGMVVPLVGAAVLGGVAFVVGNRLLAHGGLAGRTWFAADVRPSWASLVVALVLAAVFLTLARGRSQAAIADPLRVRRDRPKPRAGRLALVPLGLGLALFVAIVVASSAAIVPDELVIGTRLFALHVAATCLTAGGLVLAAPTLSRVVGSVTGRWAASVGTHLAGRSVEADPSGAGRVCGAIGVVLVLGTLGLAYARAVGEGAENYVEAPPRAIVVDDVSRPDLLAAVRREVGGATVVPLWVRSVPGRGFGEVVGDCAAIARVDPRVRGCRAGQDRYRLWPGGGAGRAAGAPLGLPVDRAAEPFGGLVGETLVDPTSSSLAGVDLGVPARLLVQGASPTRLDQVRRAIASADPLARANTRASYRAEYRRDHPVDDRATGVLVALLGALSVLLLVVVSIDRVLARQAADVRLQAVGTPRREVRRAAAMALLLPAAAVLSIGVLAAGASDLAWARVIHRPLEVHRAVLVLAGSAVAVTLALAYGLSWLVARPDDHPEALRRE